MSHIEHDVCDICGKNLFEHNAERGFRLRGARGKAMMFNNLFGLLSDGEVDVCETCWERIKSEMRGGRQ